MRLIRSVLSVLYFSNVVATVAVSPGVDYYLNEWPEFNSTMINAIGKAFRKIMTDYSHQQDKQDWIDLSQSAVDLLTAFAQRVSEATPRRVAADRLRWRSILASTMETFWLTLALPPLFVQPEVQKLQPLFLQQANAYIVIADAWGSNFCKAENTGLEIYNEISKSFVRLSSWHGLTTDRKLSGYDEACSITRTTIMGVNSTSTETNTTSVLPTGYMSSSSSFSGGSNMLTPERSPVLPGSLLGHDNTGVVGGINGAGSTESSLGPSNDPISSDDPLHTKHSQIAGSPASRSSTVLTTTVTAYTTYCPEPTTFCAAHTCYTITEATTITVTDCPCVLESTVGVHSPGQLLCNGSSCFPIVSATASSGSRSGSISGSSSGRMVITKSSANNANNNDMSQILNNNDMSQILRALAAMLII